MENPYQATGDINHKLSPITASSEEIILTPKSGQFLDRTQVEQVVTNHFDKMRRINNVKSFKVNEDATIEVTFNKDGQTQEQILKFTANGFYSFCRAFRGSNQRCLTTQFQMNTLLGAQAITNFAMQRIKNDRLDLLLYDNDRIEGVVTPDYAHFPTLSLLQQIYLTQEHYLPTSLHIQGLKSRTTFLTELSSHQFEVRPGDVLSLGRDLINSEDGGRAFDFGIYIYRARSRSGTVAPNNIFKRKIVHRGAASFDKAMSTLTMESTEVKAFFDVISQATEIRLTEETLEKALDHIQRKTNKGFRESVNIEYNHSDLEGPGSNLYDLWLATIRVASEQPNQEIRRNQERMSWDLLSIKL